MEVYLADEGKSFKYRPLIEPDAFRLILLQPTSLEAAQVECILLHSTLSTCDREIIDHYTALSYVWGDAQQTKQISLEGCQTTITATLEAALRDLRDEKRVLRVWADALCIDQSNVEERNQQVRQMGRIYSTAHHTVIYLGSSTLQVETVLNAILSRSSGKEITMDARKLENVVQTAERRLLNRPWFSRVWVFQELVLSRDPWVQCEHIRVRWTDLCDLLMSYDRKRAGLKMLTEMHFARERSAQTDMFHLLLSRQGLGATDARDMVFAHLGVASDYGALDGHIKVDYKQSVEMLYEDIACYLIETIGPQTMFSHIDNVDHTLHRQNLASWAPDWTLLPSPVTSMYRDNRMNIVTLKPKLHYTFTQEPRVLAYIGYEVDIISSVSLGIDSVSQQTSAKRTSYQKAVADLHALYTSAGGSYATGDENGQYTRIHLGDKRMEHQDLYLKLGSEWLHIMRDELPLSLPTPSGEELDSHRKFADEFQSWLRARATRDIIAVGGSAEGMESIMYTHLHSNTPPSILNGRRLATTISKRLGVVPWQAREGDIIVYLAGIPTSVVLRPSAVTDSGDFDEQIYGAFDELIHDIAESNTPYSESFVSMIRNRNGNVKQASLVGECYVEGVIGWSFKDRYQHHDFNIYALH